MNADKRRCEHTDFIRIGERVPSRSLQSASRRLGSGTGRGSLDILNRRWTQMWRYDFHRDRGAHAPRVPVTDELQVKWELRKRVNHGWHG